MKFDIKPVRKPSALTKDKILPGRTYHVRITTDYQQHYILMGVVDNWNEQSTAIAVSLTNGSLWYEDNTEVYYIEEIEAKFGLPEHLKNITII